jgi:CubicO group peptidase (beta-lactamase class C family)
MRAENTMRRRGGGLLVCFAALALVCNAALEPSRGSDQTMDDKIGALFSPLVDANSPGAAVLVKKDGKILFEKGYGVRDLRTRAKIAPQTNFRLASFTKQFTAMAIMLLVHDRRLRYDDKLTDIFHDFPAYGKDITIRHLLNHTSGLPDYEEVMDREEKSTGKRWGPDYQIQDQEVLNLLKAQPGGLFPPGTRWEYSNSGYVVLGLIVAKVSGISYRDFLRQRIFSPLKMHQTLVYEKGKNEISRRAFGHNKENDVLVEGDQSATSATLGDGGIYSNIVDLAKWDEGLRKHALLSEKEMEPALTPAKLADGSETHWPPELHAINPGEPRPVSYGFGWFLDPYNGHARNYHDGGTRGFRTTIQRFVDDHVTIVVLSNRTDLNPDELSLKIADMFLQPAAR